MPKIKLTHAYVAGVFILTLLGVHHYSSRHCITTSTNTSPKQRFRLVVLVLSAPENSERRDVIRKTWLSQKPSEVRSIFAVGTASLAPEQIQTLESEAKKHVDLLLLPKLHDSYGTITKKVLLSLIHAHESYDYDFLLKADDDSFALVDQLLKYLNRWQAKGSKKELYWGYFNGRARVKRSGPWKESDWFLCDYYLPYTLGGGYVLSYNLVKFVAENADNLKYAS